MNEPERSIIILYLILVGVLLTAAGLIWLERRLLGLWQDRYGPNRAGRFGSLQVAADMIKIFTKEDWIPPFADKPVFVIAPAIIVVTTLLSFAIIPFAPGIEIVNLNIGLLFFLAMSSIKCLQRGIGGMGFGQQVFIARRFKGRCADARLRSIHGPVARRSHHARGLF